MCAVHSKRIMLSVPYDWAAHSLQCTVTISYDSLPRIKTPTSSLSYNIYTSTPTSTLILSWIRYPYNDLQSFEVEDILLRSCDYLIHHVQFWYVNTVYLQLASKAVLWKLTFVKRICPHSPTVNARLRDLRLLPAKTPTRLLTRELQLLDLRDP
jgi:hypothetical protein